MPAKHHATKRSKTFTGCWTCRDRGVKCDLAKPTCARCDRSKRTCGGYGIRLVWLDHDALPPKEAQRRMLSESHRQNPIYTEAYLTEALEDIDALEDPVDLRIGPFSVFQSGAVTDNHDRIEDLEIDEFLPNVESDTGPSASGEVVLFEKSPLEPIVGDMNMTLGLKAQILPMLQPYLASASIQERRLLHHWVTSLSGVYLPIPGADNPYRNIIIPLALRSATSPTESSGHAALLHIIYAIAASHLTQRDSSQTQLRQLADQHYHLGLQLLRCSLDENDDRQRSAILAAVILMSTMECITGISHRWRVHVKGGREWLRLQGSFWETDPEASILCQLFECIEVIGDTQGAITNLSTEQSRDSPVCQPALTVYDNRVTSGPGYCLDKYLGLPKPVFDAICRINQLRNNHRLPDLDEITNLCTSIALTRPNASQTPDDSTTEDKRLFHYAWVYHYACCIYFEREFRFTPLSGMQSQIKDGLDHLEIIYALDEATDVCGLLWPTFVMACRAEKQDHRQRFMSLLVQDESRGVTGAQVAAQAIREYWKQSDMIGTHSIGHPQQTFQRIGFDLILT